MKRKETFLNVVTQSSWDKIGQEQQSFLVEAGIIETGDIQNQWDSEMVEGGGWEYVYSLEKRGHGTPSSFL